MKEVLDIALNRNEDIGLNDIDFQTGGEFVLDTTLGTAIRVSLFTEKRASASEVPNTAERGGWWGNVALENETAPNIGSKLWLLSQSKLTRVTLNLAIAYSRDALQWMINQGFVDKIEVSGELNKTNRSIMLFIRLIRQNTILADERIEFLNMTTENIN